MPPLLKLLWTVGSKKSVKDSFDFEFQSRLHECEATTARDKFILLAVSRYAFVCRLFLLPESRLQLNDRLDGIWPCDDLPLMGASTATLRWDSGAGREKRHSGRPAKVRRESVSTGITSIGLWPPQSRPQKCGRIHKPEGVWTNSGGHPLNTPLQS